jgi:hypothetical protein
VVIPLLLGLKKFIYCSGIIVDGLYIIIYDSYVLNNYVLEPTHHSLSLKRKIPSTNEAYFWHLLLGHINSKRIQRLVNDGFLNPIDFQDYPIDKSYLEGKMTKRHFSGKMNRAKDLLKLVFTNVCGPMSVPALLTYKFIVNKVVIYYFIFSIKHMLFYMRNIVQCMFCMWNAFLSKKLSHKILVHNPCSLKLMDSSQSVMELGIQFANTVTHRLFGIYFDQVKLKASGWCVGVMH